MVLRKTFVCGAVLACAALALAGPAVSADDPPALSGVWARKEGEMKIEFADKDVLKLSPHGKDEVILVRCKYTREKGGVVKAKITGYEGREREKAQGVIPVGLEFRFTWQVKGDAATLGDVKGDNVEHLKTHLEGEYERKP